MKKQYIQPQSQVINCEPMHTICASGDTRISVKTGFIDPGEMGD